LGERLVEKKYSWKEGAILLDHTRRKHKVLREYIARYLAVRCQFPAQTRFRLAVVEGFAGGGRYICGTAGSPIVFIEELRVAAEGFNLKRKAEGMAPLDIECFLVLNDADPEVLPILKSHVEPLLAEIKQEVPKLYIKAEYMSKPFEEAYPIIKALLLQGRYQSVLFNLDQCGHSHVDRVTLRDISVSFNSAEIFYTFAVASLIAFLHKANPKLVLSRLGFLGVTMNDLSVLEGKLTSREWLGAAERLVFEAFQGCAEYVSPFSINNPEGWQYWLIHFANNYRARQEYNNVLHDNSTAQAHYGRSGLHMLSYDPQHNDLYLFDVSGRDRAKQQLMEDIPRLVTEFGDAVNVGEFYSSIYNMTPSHAQDIHAVMIESPDLAVVTEAGGERRRPNTIVTSDTLQMKQQITFFPMFLGKEPNNSSC
jgi:three-Cys-motif partner protein